MRISWRLATEQQPLSEVEVIGRYSWGNELVYFDGEYWINSLSNIVVDAPLWWMYIPLTPDE
jgi:hypothetical protein